MNLVMIYGPPASGKLTIANKLEKKTGYKNFHNHLVVDLISKFVPIASNRFWENCHEIRLGIIKTCIHNNVSGIIMTHAYSGDEDKYFKNLFKLVSKNKGKVLLVQLKCDKKVLEKRINSESRKKHGKITSIIKLNEWLGWVKKNSYNYKNHIVIETDDVDPDRAANTIINNLKII